MTNKAYIVANKQQEREVLEKFEEKGALWGNGKNATNFIPFSTFPYVIYCNGDKYIFWDKLGDLDVEKIIAFDGRNEEQMSEKYVVSQEFMNELVEWKNEHETELEISLTKLIDPHEVTYLATIVDDWWLDSNISNIESNNRLIAIIRWVNGQDVFEVEKPKKWVVRSKETDNDGYHIYVSIGGLNNIQIANPVYRKAIATRFDTREEAESWANAHQEVVQVEVDE